MNTKHIISSIFNYCDRWCERCAFIDRCAMGAIEQKRWAKGADWQPEDFFAELEKMYPRSEDKMAQWLEENDIDLSEIEPADLPRPDLKTKQLEEEMRERGSNYYKPLKTFLEANDEGLKARGIDLFSERDPYEGRDTQERSALAEAMEVILWYQYFMFVKAGRAIGGLEDMHDTFVWKTADQSDANGSAKVAMIAAERSLGAWEMVRRCWPEKQQEVLGFMRQINGFRHRMERVFPHWRKFVRPGFDTEPPQVRPFEMN
ncbi:MAG: hypothetical protein ACKVUS_17900 [Saprospiraceae bacterium]